MKDPLDTEKTMDTSGRGNKTASLQPGSTLGQYRIIRLLGRGGMGEVYEVEHKVLDRRYALKLLPADFVTRSGAMDRFEREARVMANLRHQGIIQVDEFGETEGHYWLRMELAEGLRNEEGESIEGLLMLQDYADYRGGKIPQEELLYILQQICDGLDYAHKHGVVHRDLKPSNILFSQTSNGEAKVKIADFGLVRLVGEDWVRSQADLSVRMSMSIGDKRTMVGSSAGSSARSMLGTYEYMSPEQKRGEEADERSDIYSLGLMTFKLLTGQDVGMRTPSQLNSDLVKQWDNLILETLEQDPKDRLSDCAKFLRCLNIVEQQIKQKSEQEEELRKARIDAKGEREEERIELIQKQAGEKHIRKEERKRSGLWLVILGLLIAGGWWFMQNGNKPENKPQATARKGSPLSLDLGNNVKMELVWIEAGEFMMGSPDNESGREDDE